MRMRRAGALWARLVAVWSDTADAPSGRWAMVTVWASAADREQFDASPAVAAWRARAVGHLRWDLAPHSAHGVWAGAAPFGAPYPTGRTFAPGDPVVAVTRGVVRADAAAPFAEYWQDAAAAARGADGALMSWGFRDVTARGLGTDRGVGSVSVWRDHDAVTAYAHGDGPHAKAVQAAEQQQWFIEHITARFSLTASYGGFTD